MLKVGCHLLHVFQGKIITPAIRPYSKVISRKLYLDSFQFRNSQVGKCGNRLNFLTRIFTFVDNSSSFRRVLVARISPPRVW